MKEDSEPPSLTSHFSKIALVLPGAGTKTVGFQRSLFNQLPLPRASNQPRRNREAAAACYFLKTLRKTWERNAGNLAGAPEFGANAVVTWYFLLIKRY